MNTGRDGRLKGGCEAANWGGLLRVRDDVVDRRPASAGEMSGFDIGNVFVGLNECQPHEMTASGTLWGGQER